MGDGDTTGYDNNSKEEKDASDDDSEERQESILGKRKAPDDDDLVAPEAKKSRGAHNGPWSKGSVFNGCVFNLAE